jgi:hypothetical protein
VNPNLPLEYLIVPVVFLVTMIVFVVTAFERSRREQHRLELQKAILERIGSVKDFAEFLTTEQGERFLGSLAPVHFRPHHRTLWSVRFGIVLLTIGVFMMGALHSTLFGSFGDTPPPPLLMAMLLLIATGIGMLLSAIVGFVVARGLGMSDGRNGGTGKGRPG